MFGDLVLVGGLAFHAVFAPNPRHLRWFRALADHEICRRSTCTPSPNPSTETPRAGAFGSQTSPAKPTPTHRCFRKEKNARLRGINLSRQRNGLSSAITRSRSRSEICSLQCRNHNVRETGVLSPDPLPDFAVDHSPMANVGQIVDDPTNVFCRPPVPDTARPAQRDGVAAEDLFRSSGRRDTMRLAGVIVEIPFGMGLTGFERTNSAMRSHVSISADFQLPSRRRSGSGVAIRCPRQAVPATTGRHFQLSNADGRRVHAFGSPEPGLRSAGSGPGSEAQGNAPHGPGPVMARGFGHAGQPMAP